jgi:hypothetical protein
MKHVISMCATQNHIGTSRGLRSSYSTDESITQSLSCMLAEVESTWYESLRKDNGQEVDGGTTPLFSPPEVRVPGGLTSSTQALIQKESSSSRIKILPSRVMLPALV